jgi:hypothetical protein
MVHRECGMGKDGEMDTPLAKSFYPLKLTPEMDDECKKIVVQNNLKNSNGLISPTADTNNTGLGFI